MSLILHCGANEVDYDALCAVQTPQRTATHVPLPHHELVGMTKYALGYYQHEVVEEHYATTEDGMEFFGLLTLRSEHGLYTDTCGLRNSHAKRFPIGIAFGAKVMVCDNLSFYGDHVIRRKHTANSRRDLPGLVAEIIEPLASQRQAQALTFDRYKATELSDGLADQTIMQLYREGILNVTRIADVVRQWDEPEYDWGERTAFRLFNATTYALTGRIAAEPHVTRRLHDVIDGVCEVVH